MPLLKEEFEKLWISHIASEEKDEISFILRDQYYEAYETLREAYNAKLHVGIVGPVGCGKTALCRKFANDQKIGFSWITFNDLIRPATLIGSFDPSLVFKTGYSLTSFHPGPFTIAVMRGDIFFANELNRGQEFVLNTLLDVLEEKKLYIPQLKTWLNVDENFFFIAAMNPAEMRGTRVLPQAIKDRVNVWIKLEYPKKNVEFEIIKMNCPGLRIQDNLLEKIVEIVDYTRKHSEVSIPASIRSSISIVKLLASRADNRKIEINSKLLKEVSQQVLSNAIELNPGIDRDIYIAKMLDTILGD